MNKYKLALKGKEISEELIRRQQEPPEGLEELALKFKEAFYKLPDFATRLCEDYREITSVNWPNPGVIVLVLGGGRTGNHYGYKSKLLRASSDLDIYFLVENFEGSIDPYAWGPSFLRDGSLLRERKRIELRKGIIRNAEEFKIPVPIDLRSYGSLLEERIFSNEGCMVLGISSS